jgi:hypothetical protein
VILAHVVVPDVVCRPGLVVGAEPGHHHADPYERATEDGEALLERTACACRLPDRAERRLLAGQAADRLADLAREEMVTMLVEPPPSWAAWPPS